MGHAKNDQLADFLSGGQNTDTLVHTDRIDRILGAVRDHLGMEIAFVSRYIGEDDRELTHISTDLDLPYKPGFQEPKQDTYCYNVLLGNLPEMIQDPKDHPFAKDLPMTDALPVGCHLNIPLRLSDGTVYGSFCCLSPTPNRTVTERDMGVLRAFSTLAAEHIESDLSGEMHRSRLTNTIKALIEGKRLTIVQQPIHDLKSGAAVGVECLARFPDADQRGPDSWFNEASEVGLGVELEMLAVRCALETLPLISSQHYVSINASPETILSGALGEALQGQTSEQLVIEVTEHQQVDDFGKLANALRDLAGKARIAIDDVGAGYAGLRHIVDLEPDILKLDMSLTRNVHHDPVRRALAGAMVGFAGEIGASIVAEGIETPEECEALTDLGVTYGQGYHYSRPLPVVVAQQYLMGVDHRQGEAEPAPIARPPQAESRKRA